MSNWITRASSKLDYDQIDRNRYCELVKQRFKRLNGEDEKIKLNKLSILQYPYPLETEQMAHFLEMDLDHLQLFLDEVISIGVFEQRGKYQWFRHELAQYCISSSLLPAIKKTAHKYAADFYLKQLDISSNSSTTGGESKIALNNTTIGCAYHLHEAGLHKESLDFNVKLAAYAARIGELDLAERCYLRAIEDAVNLGDDKSKMDLIFELTRNIYYTWGRYEESVENYKQLLKYYSENGNEGNLAVTLNNLGIIYQKRGEYEAALEKYNESLEIAEKLGNQKRYALIIRQIGTLLRTIENYKDAIPCLYSAYNIFDELKLDPEKQFALQNIQEIRDKIGENEFNVIIQSLYSDEKHE